MRNIRTIAKKERKNVTILLLVNYTNYATLNYFACTNFATKLWLIYPYFTDIVLQEGLIVSDFYLFLKR